MTGPQLATLATIAWLVLTTILFLELANWSAGGSWTIVPGIVRGVRGVRGWMTHAQEDDLAPFALAPAPRPGSAGRRASRPRAPLARDAPTPDEDAEALELRGPLSRAAGDDPLHPDIVELDHSSLRATRVRSSRR